MKKKLINIALAGTLLFSYSCKSWIEEDYNIDPNSPSDVTLDLILPGTQMAWGYYLGGDLSRYNSIFIQQVAGVDRQMAGTDSYSFTESEVDNVWASTYATVLEELSIVISKSQDEGAPSPHYEGIAQVMTASVLLSMSDLYGDMPYSEAFGLAENLRPKYDTQEEIYATILTLLSDGRANLGAAESTFEPGSDDVIYGGDLASWTAFAYAIEAKAHLHLGLMDAGNYTKAIDAVNNSFTANGEDALIPFYSSVTENNPWFQFNDQRGDIRMGKNLVDMMLANNDPRLASYCSTDDNGDYVGSGAGEANVAASFPDGFWTSGNSPVALATYYEMLFIKAEALFQTGDAAGAAAAFNDAVMANLSFVGVSDGAFEAAVANEDAGSITLEKIMNQKYVAMFTQSESYTDWRRTGFPVLTPATGETKIPTKWPYAQSERFYNGDNLPSTGGDKYDKVWWDIN